MRSYKLLMSFFCIRSFFKHPYFFTKHSENNEQIINLLKNKKYYEDNLNSLSL